MTREGWREAVIEAGKRYESGDAELLETMASLLTEQDAAKQTLRDAGFGVTGTPWPDVVDEVVARFDSYYSRI